MKYYYISSDSNVVGPMPEDAIRGLRKGGVLNDASLITCEGSQEWTPYCEVFPSSGHAADGVSFLSTRYVLVAAASACVLVCLSAILVSRGLRDRGPSNTRETALAPATSETAASGGDAGAPLTPDVKVEPIQAAQPNVMLTSKPMDSFQKTEGPSTPSDKTQSIPNERQASATIIEPEKPLNPSAEWYDIGFRQGVTAKKVYEAFGVEVEPTRGGLFQILKNLGVEASEIAVDHRKACVDGYGDALLGKPVAMEISSKQQGSVLPPTLRGYHRFDDGAIGDPADDFASRARAATVIIFNVSDEGVGQGSGFFIGPGILLTNRHVVENAKRLRVRMPDKSLVTAELIQASTSADVALLRVQSTHHPVLRMSSSQNVKIGANICAVGFPKSFLLLERSGELDAMEALKNLDPTSTYGRVGGRTTFDATKCFHVDLNINHGNSGGPVVDSSGDVIGLSTYGLGDTRGVQGLNYAVESDIARQFVRGVLPDLKLD